MNEIIKEKLDVLEEKIETVSDKQKESDNRLGRVEEKMENFMDALIGDMKTPGIVHDFRAISAQQAIISEKLEKTAITLDKITEKQNVTIRSLIDHSDKIVDIENDICELKNKISEIEDQNIKVLEKKAEKADQINEEANKAKWEIIKKVGVAICFIILGVVTYAIMLQFGIKINIEPVLLKLLGG